MDIKRDPAILRKKKIRQGIIAGFGILVLIVITVAVMRLRPAAPSVPVNTLWFGTVKRGPMTREVHGAGTLVPEEIRWITATTSGRVDKILLRPGAQMRPGTVILHLTNPDLQQQVMSAKLAWSTAEAQLANQRSTLSRQRLSQQSNVTDLESKLKVAQANLDANESLARQGIVSELTIKQLQAGVEQAKNSLELAKKQLTLDTENEASQIAPQQATVNQQKAAYELVSRQLEDLKVKSSLDGVLQLVNVQEGQQVAAGFNLARVADPTTLKAEIRISETQTKDLAIGQKATVDTRNGIVKGHVTRIDPASSGGTVGVDVSLDDALPPGARPDLSVDGTIELQRLDNILYVERPAFAQESGTVSLFRIVPSGGPVAAGQEAGHEAALVPVKLGRSSVQFIEVVEGLQVGDRVVLSDMQQYDQYPRVRLTAG